MKNIVFNHAGPWNNILPLKREKNQYYIRQYIPASIMEFGKTTIEKNIQTLVIFIKNQIDTTNVLMININFSIKSFDYYLHLLECEWMGKCISVNTTWDHPTQCLTYKCVLGESTGIARVSSDLWGRSRIKIPTVIRR